jgi:anti-sigma B factor antagonist
MNTQSGPNRNLAIAHATGEDGTPVLICNGRFVLESSHALKDEVKKLSPHHKLVEADLNGVDYVDSAGLGALLGIYVSAQNDGCHLKLINVNPRVKDLLNMTHLTSVFEKR